jgi:hypothetical protein
VQEHGHGSVSLLNRAIGRMSTMKAVLALVGVFLSCAVLLAVPSGAQPPTTRYRELNESERAGIATSLSTAKSFVAALSPPDADKPITPEVLDRAWAAWLQTANSYRDAYTVKAVGMQFGQLLVDQGVFKWIVATDAYGTDIAVLAAPGRGDITIFPVSVVEKRWQDRQATFFVSVMAAMLDEVAKVGRAWDNSPPR